MCANHVLLCWCSSSLQSNNIENRSTLSRCGSVGRQFRSGSVSNTLNRFNKPNNNCVDSDDVRSVNHENDPPSRQRAFSTIDLSFGNRANPNWSMPQQQFMHNHGYPYHHPVIIFYSFHFWPKLFSFLSQVTIYVLRFHFAACLFFGKAWHFFHLYYFVQLY